jgi:hypothetical protein
MKCETSVAFLFPKSPDIVASEQRESYMRRVFADIEDRETGSWGFHCPCCKVYLTEDRPAKSSIDARCADCDAGFLVTFFDEESKNAAM